MSIIILCGDYHDDHNNMSTIINTNLPQCQYWIHVEQAQGLKLWLYIVVYKRLYRREIKSHRVTKIYLDQSSSTKASCNTFLMALAYRIMRYLQRLEPQQVPKRFQQPSAPTTITTDFYQQNGIKPLQNAGDCKTDLYHWVVVIAFGWIFRDENVSKRSHCLKPHKNPTHFVR